MLFIHLRYLQILAVPIALGCLLVLLNLGIPTTEVIDSFSDVSDDAEASTDADFSYCEGEDSDNEAKYPIPNLIFSEDALKIALTYVKMSNRGFLQLMQTTSNVEDGYNLQNIKELEVDMHRIYNTRDESLRAVASLGKQLTTLRKLHLNFEADSQLTDYGIRSIVKDLISSQSELEDLYLNLYNIYCVNDELLKTIASSSKHLKGLKRLYLDVSFNQEITDTGIKHLSEEMISQMPELQDLSLILVLYKIGDESLKSISSQINQLKNLKNLKMTFSRSYPYDPNITDDGIKCLIEGLISQLSDLQSLDLDFSIDKISDESLKSFASLARLQNLKKLILHLSWGENITNIGIQYLAEGLISKLMNLEELTLVFWELQNTTSEGLIAISSHSRQLKQLKKLNLYLYGSDNAIIHLTQNLLPQLSHLEHLDLFFKFNEKDDISAITDESLKVIASQAIQFKNLKTLNLCFETNKVTDNGIGHLAEALAPLIGLEGLTLGFFGNANITTESLKNVVYYVKFLKNLKRFSAYGLGYPDEIKLIKKELSFIPDVVIL